MLVVVVGSMLVYRCTCMSKCMHVEVNLWWCSSGTVHLAFETGSSIDLGCAD